MEKLTIPPELLSDPEHVASIVTVGQLNSLLESGHITARSAALLCPHNALHLLKPQRSFSYTQEAQQVLAELDQLWSTYQSTNNRPKTKTLTHKGECLLARAMTNLKEFIFWETQP